MDRPTPAPFTVSAEGTTTYEYRSTDGAGNVEAAKTLTVRIDKTAPVTAVSGVPAGWSKTPLTATFSPGDAASGVAHGRTARTEARPGLRV